MPVRIVRWFTALAGHPGSDRRSPARRVTRFCVPSKIASSYIAFVERWRWWGCRRSRSRPSTLLRLREAGVKEETIADILWHDRRGMTAHYSVAQIVEIRDAVELITDERNRFNKGLAPLFRQKSPQKVATAEKKRVRC